MALKSINNDIPCWEWNLSKDYVSKDFYMDVYNYNCFLQYKFFEQWHRLKKYANSKEVEIFGDIPIYVSQDSSDFYFSRDMFLVDKDGYLNKIAGVPPNEFSSEGQILGNPLYDWNILKKMVTLGG